MSNFSMHRNLEELLKQIAGPHCKVSDLLDWGVAQESAFVTSSQMLLMLLVQVPHFEKPSAKESPLQVVRPLTAILKFLKCKIFNRFMQTQNFKQTYSYFYCFS